MYLSRIDPATFSAEQFESAGIAIPVGIARSVPKRQAEFLHGRWAARHALARLALEHITVGIGHSREPVWPAGVLGSISHNRHHAAAVAIREGDHEAIGIDIETIISANAYQDVLAMAASPAEMALMKQLEDRLGPELLLTILFSAKESFYKAAFPTVRRFFGFEAVELTALDSAAGTVTFTLTEHLSESMPAGARLHGRYVMLDEQTVCTYFCWPVTGRTTASRT